MRNLILPPENVVAKEIPNYPGYWATDDGRIWSVHKGGYFITPHLWQGYERVQTTIARRRVCFKVHQAVALAWHGPRPDGHIVRHLNGIKRDNRPSNLAYGTHRDNRDDERRLGRWAKGSAGPTTRLAPETVRTLIEMRGAGVGYKEAARITNLRPSTVRDVYFGRSWPFARRTPFAPPLRLVRFWSTAQTLLPARHRSFRRA